MAANANVESENEIAGPRTLRLRVPPAFARDIATQNPPRVRSTLTPSPSVLPVPLPLTAWRDSLHDKMKEVEKRKFPTEESFAGAKREITFQNVQRDVPTIRTPPEKAEMKEPLEAGGTPEDITRGTWRP